MLLSIMITGCGESSQIETPPWTDYQVQSMENENIDTCPVSIYRY